MSCAFQSTHPHGVRLIIKRQSFSVSMFQSTHPHGVRHQVFTNIPVYDVSIHAPAWGATDRSSLDYNVEEVSIHAPAWGATYRTHYCTSSGGFQSTHPHGVRPRLKSRAIVAAYVSIHAPAWGATCAQHLF